MNNRFNLVLAFCYIKNFSNIPCLKCRCSWPITTLVEELHVLAERLKCVNCSLSRFTTFKWWDYEPRHSLMKSSSSLWDKLLGIGA